MKKRKTLILMLSLVCLLVVGIGFAAITRSLTVTGNVTVNPNTAGFKVEFIEKDGYTVDENDPLTATIELEASDAFNAVGETQKVTLTIKNSSTDNYNASIAIPTINYDGDADKNIEVTTNWDSAKTVDKGAETTIEVTVKLIKAQTEENQTFSFDITLVATAVAA
jgi:hypothetical protein